MWKFARLDTAVVLSSFEVDLNAGLRPDQVTASRSIHGLNELPKEQKVTCFFTSFRDLA